jgi:tRNA threonylcarbamoyladenosine biosynthesis protein TsaB
VVAIQAGRGRFAVSEYRAASKQWQAQGEARVVSLEALMAEAQSPLEMCGEFTDEIRQQILLNENVRLASPMNSLRRPSMLAELAWARWKHNDVDDAATLAPLYLHTADPIV